MRELQKLIPCPVFFLFHQTPDAKPPLLFLYLLRKVAIVHRLGRVPIGEASVAVAVSSAHRAEAFEACRFLIDTLKRDAPIWKREHFEDGTVEWSGHSKDHGAVIRAGER